jgi:hypothetical protein
MTPSRLAQLLAGARAVHAVPFPGRDGVVVGLRPLTVREMADAKVAAMAVVERAPQGALLQQQELYDDELAVQTLARALVDRADATPLAASADEVRDLLTVGQLGELLEHYLETCADLVGDEDAVLQEADDLGKAGGSATTSRGPSRSTPNGSSADRPSTAPTASSSTSSPESDDRSGSPRRRPRRGMRLLEPSSSAAGGSGGS